MKSFTSIEQSKKLAEILPIESADMAYIPSAEDDEGNTLYTAEYKSEIVIDEDDKDIINCWSLAALLEIIPKDIEGLNRLRIDIDNVDFSIWYDDLKGYGVNDKLPDITLKEPVDACVEMIVKLKEKGLI